MTRAVLYLRLSAIVDDSTSIARQEADLRALADREGWEVVALLVDEGLSGRKARRNATAAVRMLRDGDADVLAVWKLDRFTRQGWDGLGELSRALDARPNARFVALQDGLTSDSPAFRLVAGVLSEVARSEADNTAARQRSAIDYRRRHGKYAGGSAVPFGYRSEPAPDGVGRVLRLSPFESAIIREAARRYLDDAEPLSKIASDFERRGIATSKSPARRAIMDGKPTTGLSFGHWAASTVRSYLTSPSLLGRVTHRGELLRGDDGLPVTVWPPVLDAATAAAIAERLVPAHRKAPPARRAARLLSGVAYCGRCGSKLYVTTSGGKPVYRCATSWNNPTACTGLLIAADGLDDYVASQFLAVAGSWPETTTDPAGVDELARAEVELALRDAAAAMLDDDADVAALAERMRTLKQRRQELRAPSAPSAPRPTGRTLAEAWAEHDSPDWRRRVLLAGLDHVEVDRATARGISPIDPRRVRLFWVS